LQLKDRYILSQSETAAVELKLDRPFLEANVSQARAVYDLGLGG
jgi:hypothetical protein